MDIYNEFETLVNSSVIGALKTCNWSVEHDDAVQIGWEALLLCLKKRDNSKGAGFYSFARLRVRGAVLDVAKKQTKVLTTNGVQKRLNNLPLSLDAYDESTIDNIVGSVAPVDTLPNMAIMTKGIKSDIGKKIIKLRFELDLRMYEISSILGIGASCLYVNYKCALNELAETVLKHDYRD